MLTWSTLFLVNVAAVSTFMVLSQLPCRLPVLLNTDEALIFRRTVIPAYSIGLPLPQKPSKNGLSSTLEWLLNYTISPPPPPNTHTPS